MRFLTDYFASDTPEHSDNEEDSDQSEIDLDSASDVEAEEIEDNSTLLVNAELCAKQINFTALHD